MISGGSVAEDIDNARSLHIAFVAIAPHVKDIINAAPELVRRGHKVTVASYGHDGERRTDVETLRTSASASGNPANPIRFLDTGALPAALNI